MNLTNTRSVIVSLEDISEDTPVQDDICSVIHLHKSEETAEEDSHHGDDRDTVLILPKEYLGGMAIDS